MDAIPRTAAGGLGALLLLLTAPLAGAQETPPVIQVSANAAVDVPADRAHVRFAVETQAPSAAEATGENADRMDAVIRALRRLEVPGMEIETSGYQLNPVYNRPERGATATIEGYRALNHVEVTLGDVEAVGRVIDVGVTSGANRVAGLGFEATDTRAARLEALEMAVQKAREEAQTMADALGVALGAPLEVRGGAETPGPVRLSYARAEMMQAQATTPVEAGEHTVRASVTVKYRILFER